MTKKALIVFSGFNQRAVVAFLRTLEQKHVAYTLIASSPEDSIFQTKYRQRVSCTRKVKALSLDDLLESIRKAKKTLIADEYVITPSTEALNRFIIKHRNVFESQGCNIPLIDEALYEKLSDKYAFGELCKQHGIRVPAEYESIELATLPCVAKPRKYVAADGRTYSPILIHTRDELESFKELFAPSDFYFQEFIDGESLYLLYYFYRGGTVAKFSQKNLIQQPDGKSIIAAVSSEFHTDQESDKYEKLFKSIGFNGLVMVEVKNQNGLHYMIEANPRFWGPSQLFIDAGVNLFEAFLFDNGFISTKPNVSPEPKETRYFWYGGMTGLSDDKVTYHGYSKELFEKERDDWMAADVYSREDTKYLYKQELEGPE